MSVQTGVAVAIGVAEVVGTEVGLGEAAVVGAEMAAGVLVIAGDVPEGQRPQLAAQ